MPGKAKRPPSRKKSYAHQSFFPFAKKEAQRNRIMEIFEQNKLGKRPHSIKKSIRLPLHGKMRADSWMKDIAHQVKPLGIEARTTTREIYIGYAAESYSEYAYLHVSHFVDARGARVFTVISEVPQNRKRAPIEKETQTWINFTHHPLAEKAAKLIAEKKRKMKEHGEYLDRVGRHGPRNDPLIRAQNYLIIKKWKMKKSR